MRIGPRHAGQLDDPERRDATAAELGEPGQNMGAPTDTIALRR